MGVYSHIILVGFESTDPQVVAARKKLEDVIATCPKTDARPQYTPTPPQPWNEA